MKELCFHKNNIKWNEARIKQYGLVFDKRVIHTDTKSPYGYERIGEEVELLQDL